MLSLIFFKNVFFLKKKLSINLFRQIKNSFELISLLLCVTELWLPRRKLCYLAFIKSSWLCVMWMLKTRWPLTFFYRQLSVNYTQASVDCELMVNFIEHSLSLIMASAQFWGLAFSRILFFFLWKIDAATKSVKIGAQRIMNKTQYCFIPV